MGNLRFRNVAVVCAAAAWLAGSAAVSAQTCPAVKVDCLQPRALADSGGARFAWGVTDERSSKDAWVARYERGAKEPAWKVPIGGSGEESIATVTLIPGGELLVAGGTTSPTIPGVAGRNAGGRDGLVVLLDAETGRVLSGSFVGGSGNEELTGVTADSKGTVLVSGLGKLPESGAAPATVTVVESSSALGPGADVFLASLDDRLSKVQLVHALGPIRVKHPRIWLDCAGNIVIGVVALGGGNDCNGNWPDLVYQQDQIGQDYEIDHDWNDTTGNLGFPPGGWGYHALRWKYYHANAVQPPFDLDWGLRPTNIDIPKDWNPACGDDSTLNNLETYLFTQNSVVTDPLGWWSCGSHANVAELALFSAHFFHRWGTPVYTHLGHYSNLNNPNPNDWDWYTNPVALERVTFKPFCPFNQNGYNGETLDDLCDLDVNNVNLLTCTASSGIPGVNGGNYYLRFESFEGSIWGLLMTWWSQYGYWPRDFDWFWEEWYEAGTYLMDPPLNSGPEVAILQEASRQSASRVVRTGSLEVTRRDRGVVACRQTVKADFAASE